MKPDESLADDGDEQQRIKQLNVRVAKLSGRGLFREALTVAREALGLAKPYGSIGRTSTLSAST